MSQAVFRFANIANCNVRDIKTKMSELSYTHSSLASFRNFIFPKQHLLMLKHEKEHH